MSNIGERITQLRKAKNWSQDELAKQINASRIMIGNYERDSNTPSVEVIIKLADAFEVSVDYLLGQGLNASFDKAMIQRLEDMENLPAPDKEKVFDYIDMVIRDAKAKKVYAS